jgi:pimeloyl-ACP methyl ester carboxylesterase
MLRISGWRRLALAAPLTVALVVPACTSPTPAQHVSVTASPGNSSGDQAVHIEVTGLRAGQQATVRVTSTDSLGVAWVSSQTYRADAGGHVAPDQDAPVSGGYQGISGMGPVWSMHVSIPGAVKAENDGEFYWSQDRSFAFTVTVRVSGATDPAKIAVLGVSRGSEAAQLFGVHYPGLVHAVIASVPSDAAICSYPGCRTAAWTLGGKPLRSSRTSGSTGRSSWTVARPTGPGPRARTRGPSSAAWTAITTGGRTCCTPTRAPGT